MCAAPKVLLRFALQLFFEELSAFSARVRECHGKFPHGGEHACPWTLVQEYFAIPDANGAGSAQFLLRFLLRAMRQLFDSSLMKGFAEG